MLNAVKIAGVADIFQMGWDESEINRHNTMNVWVRIAAAEGSDEVTSVLLAAAKPQVRADASAEERTAIWLARQRAGGVRSDGRRLHRETCGPQTPGGQEDEEESEEAEGRLVAAASSEAGQRGAGAAAAWSPQAGWGVD